MRPGVRVESSVRRVIGRVLWLALSGAGLGGGTSCQDEFSLGSWRQLGGATSTAGAGASTGGARAGAGGVEGEGGSSGAAGAIDRLCGVDTEFSELNQAGPAIKATQVTTSWIWPDVHDSFDGEIEIESEFTSDAYFWAHQFWFDAGSGGFLGLQARGAFQRDINSKIEITNMVVFWINGSTTFRAEPGDAPDSDIRIGSSTDASGSWTTINVKYPFLACHKYRLRVSRDEAVGDSVYWAASVTEVDSGTTLKVGRIAVPAVWGRLDTRSQMWSARLAEILRPASSCSDLEPASAFFGLPSANEGAMRPSSKTTGVSSADLGCPSSRWGETSTGIRHQLAVPRP
ncbi:MAG TPA: hypothetical protein VFQ61_19055 [Polyangiaceae bacterium]|nr:hypothetical protein [Polyangiaceae bacterium]